VTDCVNDRDCVVLLRSEEHNDAENMVRSSVGKMDTVLVFFPTRTA
jgi:hypothetical protein